VVTGPVEAYLTYTRLRYRSAVATTLQAGQRASRDGGVFCSKAEKSEGETLQGVCVPETGLRQTSGALQVYHGRD